MRNHMLWFANGFRVSVVMTLLMLAIQMSLAQSASRINQAIDDSSLVRIPNSTHPLTARAADLGRVDSRLPMQRMVLVLKPSEAQETELTRLLDHQHDKNSATYHQWITPEEYGRRFGPSDEDLAQVTSWLQQKGFHVDRIARGKQWIEFSGDASQVEQAFHTEIHHFMASGEKRIANARDISVPQALAPVVTGILSLHNFPKKTGDAKRQHIHRDETTGKLVPDFTITGSAGTFHFLVPGDYKKIYNLEPLLDAGTDGRGISIAIAGRTDIFLSDVHTFRKLFGLPVNDPIIIYNGQAPGVNPEFVESSLDVEWAGAAAPKATIELVESASTLTTDGIDLSLSYIIDNAIAPIMSTSYSACEPFMGTAGNAHITGLYRQAAAEGITAFASTGDSGSANCDPSGEFSGPATDSATVSGLASTPYTVSVGGTQFNENGLDGLYWLPNNRPDLSSAIGYIPEQVWNESCDPTADPAGCFGSGLYLWLATGGGPSNCSTSTISGDFITCVHGTPKPSWQAGIGVPNDGVRDIPDLALAAAGHDGYIVCVGGFCETTESNGQTILTNADVLSGTSASTPAMAGIMALIEQKNGKYQGLANYSLYQLAAGEKLGGCNSSKLTNPTAASDCVFYDVTAGDNGIPGVPGFQAHKGYDMGAGLGSVNAANLVKAWASAQKLKSKTVLAVASQTVHHGQPLPVAVTVAPAVGTGSPTGDFSLVPDQGTPILGGSLTSGAFSGTVASLPGGSYNLKAHYAGDAMFASSDSAASTVKVLPEDSIVAAQAWFMPDEGGNWTPVTGTVHYGATLGLWVETRGVSGIGSPTGKVEVTLDQGTRLGSFPLNEKGSALVEVDQLPSSTGILPGNHTFTVTYQGDNSFHASTSTGVPVKVTKGQASLAIYSILDTVTVGTPVLLRIWAAGSSIVQPTGSVTLTDNGKNLATLPLEMNGIQGSGFLQATYTANLPVGMHALELHYAGDVNYLPGNHARAGFILTVTRPTGAAANVMLHQMPGVVKIGDSVSYVVSVLPSKAGDPIPTGTVNLLMDVAYSDGLSFPPIAPVTLVNGNATVVVPWYSAGRFMMIADYSGDSHYSKEDSRAVVTLVQPRAPTVTLSATPSRTAPDLRTELTAIIVGAPNNLNLILPDGPVQFFDSVDGGPETKLGPAQPAIGGTGQFSICVLQVKLAPGTHVLRARYLGLQPGVVEDWMAADSKSVTVRIP